MDVVKVFLELTKPLHYIKGKSSGTFCMAKSPDWDVLLQNLLRVDYSLTNYTEAIAAVLCKAKAVSVPAVEAGLLKSG